MSCYGRYVSSSEACWRLLGFGLNDRDPAVYRLAVHLPQQQTVHFSDHDRPAAILQRNSETTLTQWFKINLEQPSARHLLYTQFPQHWTWDIASKRWRPRKRDSGSVPVIGRMYMTTPGLMSSLICR